MRKRGLLILIVIGIVLIGGFGVQFLWQPHPNELVTHGLERLNGATSFRYSVTEHQWIEGKDRVLTQIQGEKDGGNSHISGHLVGSEVEMILFAGTLYNKDPFNKKWIRFTNTPGAQEVFLAELDPLSSLQLKELGEVVLSGQEKVNGDKVWVCKLKPTVQDQIMEGFWKDFTYTLYIRKSDKAVVKAIVEAKSKDKSEPMTMILEFRDFGQPIKIQAPSV
ncbi:MAG: LolA-like protein [Desulfitobacteriaceae bacterium]